jgi:histone deacetylase 1/2
LCGGTTTYSGRGTKLQCKLCTRKGHTTYYCWYRFDENLTNPNLNLDSASATANQDQKPQASLAALNTSTTIDDMWYSDIGATNRVTNYLNNVSIKVDYTGNQKVFVGNGNQIDIKHIGNTTCVFASSKIPFALHTLLYVPHITKNLINVSKFAKDNVVFFEFHPNKFVVKSQESKKALLRSHLKDELCVFNNLQFKKTYVSKFVTICTLSIPNNTM